MQKKELQTIRLWNPLFPRIFQKSEYGDVESYATELSAYDIVSYQEKIMNEIKELQLSDEGEHGLAVYLDDNSLQKKVYSIVPSVEAWEGQLWGITEVKVHEELSMQEYSLLLEVLTGQFADGWGEGLEQWPIDLPEGELYISFWNSDNFFIRREEQMLQAFTEQDTSMRIG